MERLGLIHTVARLAPTFFDLTEELLPGVEATVIVDELLLKETVRDGAVSERTIKRLRGHVGALSDYGVDSILITCSSIGAVVDAIAAESGVSVFRVDRPMAEQAVASGSSVGVLATLPTTLAPTTELVEECARAAGRDIEVVPRLCEGAFDALQGGDPERHDAIVAAALDRLVEEVDTVVLAQASMARIAAGRDTGAVSILSSPRSAVEAIAASCPSV
jgi:aspartate/glutamate racemase